MISLNKCDRECWWYMEKKQKGIGVRMTPELRAKVMEHVGKGTPYPRITDFILAAIEEKLDPELKIARERKTVKDIMRDPENFEPIFEIMVERLSQKFVLREPPSPALLQ